MKKILVCFGFVLMGVASAKRASAQDPITEIIKQAITKVIVAVDLKIQRLQTKTIWLQNVQKVVENTMSKLKLDEIGDWVQKQKDLYQNYFDELWKVKDVLSYYHKIREIAEQEIALVNQYRRAWNGVQQDHHFTPDEVGYMGQVYTGIIEHSVKNLDQIGLVINSFITQMSDQKRMQIIDEAAEAMQKNYNDLKSFTNENIQLSLQRSKDENDIAVVKALYGIE
jgi:predicted transcriptional regulator YheO